MSRGEAGSFVGALLRFERLERGLTQRYVARGICDESHLSKIENGKLVPAPDLVLLLFGRLDLRFCGDEALLSEAQEAIRRMERAALFYRDPESAYAELELLSDAARCSRLYASVRIAECGIRVHRLRLDSRDGSESERSAVRSALAALAPLEEVMSPRERGWMRFLLHLCDLTDLRGASREDIEIAVRLLRSAAVTTSHLRYAYQLGEYDRAVSLYDQAMREAVEEGNAAAQAHATVVLANLRSDLRDVREALRLYNRALELFTDLGRSEGIFWIYYNIGAMHLATGEWKPAILHLERLLHLPESDHFLYRHKLALAYTMCGNDPSTARFHLDAAARLADRSNRAEMLMLESVEMMQNPGYLRDPHYTEVLEELLILLEERYPRGYYHFNKKFLIEAYLATRQFKKAYFLK